MFNSFQAAKNLSRGNQENQSSPDRPVSITHSAIGADLRGQLRTILLTWRLNSRLCHAGLDPVSSAFLDSRLRGNDGRRVINRRSNNLTPIASGMGHDNPCRSC